MKLIGTGISPGRAIGRAFVYHDVSQRDHERYGIGKGQIDSEYARIEQALTEVTSELQTAADTVDRNLDPRLGDIFRAHQTMLGAPSLREEIKRELREELVNAEQIVRRVFHSWIHRFDGLTDPRLASRTEDLDDLSRRLLRSLRGIQAHKLQHLREGSVLVARRLLPSDTIHLLRTSAVAAVVAEGGPGSHAAILTREMGIPAVRLRGETIERLGHGETLLVDGSSGEVHIAPDQETRSSFEESIRKSRRDFINVRTIARGSAKTKAGTVVQVMATVGTREDAAMARQCGADGIGLYRTEYLYLPRRTEPSERELLVEMRRTVRVFRDKEVTIRLLDAGADKQVPFLHLPRATDPNLGIRGVRLLLDHPGLLRRQLRALLHLSQEQPVRVLVPMVTVAEDMQRAAMHMDKEAAELGISERPPLGAMIETPAAALTVRELSQHSDFFTIGTNDLTQYTMAAGRDNPFVNDYFLNNHPSVLRLIRRIVEDAGPVPVALCGELADQEEVVPDLLKAGLRVFTVSPRRIPYVKECIRGLY